MLHQFFIGSLDYFNECPFIQWDSFQCQKLISTPVVQCQCSLFQFSFLINVDFVVFFVSSPNTKLKISDLAPQHPDQSSNLQSTTPICAPAWELITHTHIPLIHTIPYITANTTGVFDLNRWTRWPEIADSQITSHWVRVWGREPAEYVNLPSPEFMTPNPHHRSVVLRTNGQNIVLLTWCWDLQNARGWERWGTETDAEKETAALFTCFYAKSKFFKKVPGVTEQRFE